MNKLYEKIKMIMAKDEIKYYFIIVIVSLFICSLLLIGYPEGHDTKYHIAKTIGTELALKEGQVLPLITPNALNGFGYSWNIFYPPLANYIMMIIKLIFHSYAQALNILMFLTVVISGIATFNLVKKITKSNKVSLLAALIYIIAPYRLVDMYIRGALGELMAFMFIPLVFNGLYNILEEDGKRHYLLAIGAIGLLLSHNISSLLVISACFIYLLVNIKKIFNRKVIKYLLINTCFILLIVMFFYGPMLQNKMATDYAVFKEAKTTNEAVHNDSIYLYQLLFGKMQYGWSRGLDDYNAQNADMCLALGLTIIVPLIFTPFIYKKIDRSKRKLYMTTLLTGLFFAILTTTIIPWSKLPEFIAFIQFPFRFLMLATFFLSIIAAINIAKLSEKLELKTIVIYTMVAFMYIAPLMQAAQISGINWRAFYDTEKLEVDQSVSDYCATWEYLPSKAYNNRTYIATRSQDPIIKSGSCIIENNNKNGLEINFDISKVKTETKIELPFIYYLGYTATINGEKLEISESDNGFIQITVKEGQEGHIEAKYTGTTLYYVCLSISIIGSITFIIYIITLEFRYRKERDSSNEKN